MSNNSLESDKHHSINETCSICLEDITNINSSITKCNHQFHSNCLIKWIIIGNQHCPLCRTKLIKQGVFNNNFSRLGWREFHLGSDIGFSTGLCVGGVCMLVFNIIYRIYF